MLRRSFLLAALALAASAPRAAAQSVFTRPQLEWRTVETPHFVIHYPAASAPWSLAMARHIESVADRVTAFVGNAPEKRTTIIVEDPLNVANGFALPLLGHPLIMMYPTPPSPHSGIGDNRGWGEMLSVHEFAHIAHLTRPSRNPAQRRFMRLLPLQVGPLAIQAPRWVTEGFATYVEGQLTGSGRPNGAWRAAVLRELALEGKLPAYGQLDATHGYLAGSMAYLVGSAYLEWLVARTGDESLDHLWRRMSARERRSFSVAFAGVFGGLPNDLYDEFTVNVTAEALRVREAVERTGRVEGELVQALSGSTGGPALSPNDSLIAVVLSPIDEPSRVVVWRTAPDSAAAARRDSARARLLRLDPEDVPAVEWRPPPLTPVAVLNPTAGRGYGAPRFLPDGRHVLVTRLAAQGDGTLLSELYEWDIRSRRVRRITHGGAIRSADPAPAGTWAAADRCANGQCDLVRVDLRSGAIADIVRGSPALDFYAPRVSADGRTIAVAVQQDGRWRIALVDVVTRAMRVVDPGDGANRYDVAFTRRGDSLVVVSDLGGITNLELLDPATGGARLLTRVLSAVFAPAPDSASHSAYFLHLRARGLDLRRVSLDSGVSSSTLANRTSRDGAPGTSALADSVLTPVLPPPPAVGDTFPAGVVNGPRDYALGPRGYRVWPAGMWTPSGRSLTVALASADPVGRLVWTLQGSYGDESAWRGVAAGATLRLWRPAIDAALFATRERPSRQHDRIAVPASADADYSGGMLAISLERRLDGWRDAVRVGGSYGVVDGPALSSERRALAFGDIGAGASSSGRTWQAGASMRLQGAFGNTDGSAWRRAMASAAIAGAWHGRGLRAGGSYGTVNADAPAYEQFLVGGASSGLIDQALLSQRIVEPGVPTGIASGARMAVLSLALSGSVLEPYIHWLAAGPTIDHWHRVIGVEASQTVAAISLVGLPVVRARAGVAYSVDEPFRHRTRFYLSLQYQP